MSTGPRTGAIDHVRVYRLACCIPSREDFEEVNKTKTYITVVIVI